MRILKRRKKLYPFIQMCTFILTLAMTCFVIDISAYSYSNIMTEEQLIEAIANVKDTPTTIIISNDIIITKAITIETGKNIIMQSAEGKNVTLIKQTNEKNATRHFIIHEYSSLTIQNITLDGNANTTSDISGGIRISDNAILIMEEGVSIQNCKNIQGGAISLEKGASLMMHGGEIVNNLATDRGAGVSVIQGSNTGEVTINNGKIHNNKATNQGGGVYVEGEIPITMNRSVISHNEAMNGGGIYATALVPINIMNSKIISNVANNSGGGIWTNNFNYLKVNSGVVFSDNKAVEFEPLHETSVPLHETNILTSRFTSPFTYAYNNYDIYYKSHDILTTNEEDTTSIGILMIGMGMILSGYLLVKSTY